jgi:hypothetical protein
VTYDYYRFQDIAGVFTSVEEASDAARSIKNKPIMVYSGNKHSKMDKQEKIHWQIHTCNINQLICDSI